MVPGHLVDSINGGEYHQKTKELTNRHETKDEPEISVKQKLIWFSNKFNQESENTI